MHKRITSLEGYTITTVANKISYNGIFSHWEYTSEVTEDLTGHIIHTRSVDENISFDELHAMSVGQIYLQTITGEK